MLYIYLTTILQVVLESFPISSSSHLFLLERYLTMFGVAVAHKQIVLHTVSAVLSRFNLIEHLLHAPTAVVVACFFFSRWRAVLFRVQRNWLLICNMVVLTGIADLATGVGYLCLGMLPLKAFPLGLGLLITAGALLSLRWCSTVTNERFAWRKAMVLGCAQCIALVPGISRLGITFVVARWLGLPNRKAFDIAWLIFWPLMLAASLHSGYWLYQNQLYHQFFSWHVLLVMCIATVLSWLAFTMVARCAYNNYFWFFSLYMLIPFILWLFV